MKKRKSYSELQTFETFQEKFEYLKLDGVVGESTFGHSRYINQRLYKSRRWKDVRNQVIARDNGCDLGVEGFPIYDRILVHHINPLSPEDIELERDCIFDLENLISTSQGTHNAVHYGDANQLDEVYVERSPGDTCPWRNK